MNEERSVIAERRIHWFWRAIEAWGVSPSRTPLDTVMAKWTLEPAPRSVRYVLSSPACPGE